MAGGGSPLKAVLCAFGANLGIAAATSWAALHTGSSSMLAEAIHVDEACRPINRIEVEIKQRCPEIGWCFIEADLGRPRTPPVAHAGLGRHRVLFASSTRGSFR